MRRLVVVGLVLAGATLVASVPASSMPGCATGTVVDLELARTEARAVELLGACDASGLDQVRRGLRADDLLFAPLYVVTVAFWSVVGARRLPWTSPTRRRLVTAAAPAVVLAGLFDLVENHHLRTVVAAGGASAAIADAFAASVAKWVLVAFAVPTSAVALVRAVRVAVRRPAGGRTARGQRASSPGRRRRPAGGAPSP